MYPEEVVKTMVAELTSAGFQSLHKAAEVENALAKEGTTLLVVNSVYGCATRNVRPGAVMSLEHAQKSNQIVTVFAGVDKDDVNAARQKMLHFPPSSPSLALSQNGEFIHMLERHHIE